MKNLREKWLRWLLRCMCWVKQKLMRLSGKRWIDGTADADLAIMVGLVALELGRLGLTIEEIGVRKGGEEISFTASLNDRVDEIEIKGTLVL